MPNKYKPGDVVDLDDVNITPAAYLQWQAAAAVGGQFLAATGRATDPSQIPDEQAMWLASGELEIFVEAGGVRFSMRIPPDQWVWADPSMRH